MAIGESAGLDLVWEVSEIAKLIGRTRRQTFHMLAGGQLPAKKVGGRWVAERGKLMAFFMETAAGASPGSTAPAAQS